MHVIYRFYGGETVSKHNRERLPWGWIITVSGLAVMLISLLLVALILDRLPAKQDPTENGTVGQATSADLYCLEFSRYSGAFVEDGTNTQVSGVAAALIENRSREFLDLATVTYDVGGRTAKFVVTGLSPGAKAWVLESNRMVVGTDAEFRFLECTSTFRQDAVTSTDMLTLSTKVNTLSIRNNSGQTLKNVCVYYKSVNDDGAYLGGITYMVAFDTLKPSETAEKAAAHFSERSQVVRYSYQTE